MGRAQQGGRPTPAWLLVPGVIERLSAMWAAGDSYNEIALAFGVTKGAIAGKIDRLELEPRPRAKSDRDHPRPPHRYEGQPRTLPPLESEPVAPRAVVAAPISIAAPRPTFTRAAECCWPSGEPGTKSFRFCEGPALPGKPYCDEHAKRAFVKVRDRKDDAGQHTVAMGAD